MFTWNFSTHKEHSASWYIMAIIVVLSLVVYGIVEGIYIMSVVSFLFAGVYILMENNSNPITRVDIDEAGIHV
jgi:MFS superfamily sulfate permease-like transporter